MPPSRILDSHIHLWPSTALSPRDHAWLKDPTHLLSKRHGISDYKATSSSSSAGSSLAGFIYVETDRYLPSKTPDVYPNADEKQVKNALKEWAKAPLEEIAFLRRVVEDTPQEGDGFESGQGEMMKGAVVWAPFHLSPFLFNAYLEIAESTAGPRLWERVVGFRYLLQGKEDGEVTSLVGSEEWVKNVVSLGKGRGGRGWAFDVGVDINRDGTEPLGAVGNMVREVREREGYNDNGALPVRFVLNHLCKHKLTASSPTKPGKEWLEAVEKLGPDQNVFMKLSGAFNEFDSTTPSSSSELVTSLSPITSRVFDAFGDRVMFGSDWPVCNVGGSVGEKGNWGLWVECVKGLLKVQKTTEADSESVWWKAGSTAYDVQL